MNFLRKNLGCLDFLHKRENYPLTKYSTQSSLGIILSISMIMCWFGLLAIEVLNYNDNYTVSFSQEYLLKI